MMSRNERRGQIARLLSNAWLWFVPLALFA
jgi:hypothetical protein